jgi:hypothetical protein
MVWHPPNAWIQDHHYRISSMTNSQIFTSRYLWQWSGHFQIEILQHRIALMALLLSNWDCLYLYFWEYIFDKFICFSVPLFIVANVSTKVTNWRVRRWDCLDFLTGDHVKVVLRPLRFRHFSFNIFHFLVEHALNSLSLSYIDVSLRGCFNNVSWDVTTLS